MHEQCKATVLAALTALVLAGCSFQNRNEREADRITARWSPTILGRSRRHRQRSLDHASTDRAVVGRAQRAGQALSVKETPANCDPGWHCFDVKFQKHDYLERMRFDENGKVVNWDFHMAPQSQ